MRLVCLISLLASVLFVSTASAQNLLVNGNWETGDETGWTQVQSSWGSNMTWTVGPPGHLFSPDNAGILAADGGSFGWVQVVEVPISSPTTIDGYWTGSTISWAEFMLFTFDHEPSDAEVFDLFDAGAVENISYKRDRWDINPPNSWDWALASLSPHPEGNSGTIASMGWVAVGLKLGAQGGVSGSLSFDELTLTAQQGACTNPHTTTGISPDSGANDADVTLTISGTNLELVTSAQLVSTADASVINGTNLTPNSGSGATSLTANFATTGATIGMYNLVTVQPAPCGSRTLTDAFELTCANPILIANLFPNSVSAPTGNVDIIIFGQNVIELASVQLFLGTNMPVIDGTNLTPDGDSLIATFNFSCVPAGLYHLIGTHSSAGCPDPEPVLPGTNALAVFKDPPPGSCVWRPWAAGWSNLNLGEDLDPPNEIYNPVNWDYTLSESTGLELPLDTPDGSDYALHWFLGAQPPDFPDNAGGSGGLYQEITVTPGVPLEYSFWWKGASGSDIAWFELLLIDGPFNIWDSDAFQEGDEGRNNPSIIRKIELPDGQTTSFEWTQVQDTDPPTPGDFGDRPTTITPTNEIVTVVLKAGRYPRGLMELFIDNIEVRQDGGSNLMVNGDLEDGTQLWICDNTPMAQDSCENDFWRETDFFIQPPCPDLYADADRDGDVDQEDFAVFQLCYTGQNLGPVAPECLCFDRPDVGTGKPDGDVDQADYQAFEACASGPMIPADPACDD